MTGYGSSMTARRLGILAGVLAGAALVARLLKGGGEEPGPPAPGPAADAEPPQAAAPPPPTPAPAAAPTTQSPTVEGYCVKERKKVQIAEPKAVKTKNGRDAVRGKCPDCGAAIFRMGKLPGA